MTFPYDDLMAAAVASLTTTVGTHLPAIAVAIGGGASAVSGAIAAQTTAATTASTATDTQYATLHEERNLLLTANSEALVAQQLGWQAQQFEFRIEDLLFAAAELLIGLALADKAYEEYKSATDDLIRLNECREELAVTIHDHRLAVTHPFQVYAMDAALGIGVISPNYGGLCSLFKSISNSSVAHGISAADLYSELMCVTPSAARRQVDYFGGASAVDAAYARARFDERREENIRQLKTDTIQTVHAGTFTNPSSVFGLIESAAQVYGYVQQQAFSQLTGAVSLISYGAGGIFSSLGFK